MAKVLLLKHFKGTSISLEGTLDANGDFEIKFLTLETDSTTRLKLDNPPQKIKAEFLTGDGAEVVLQMSDEALDLQLQWNFEDPSTGTFFGYKFKSGTTGLVTLTLHLPEKSTPDDKPYLVLCANGFVEVAATPVHAGIELGFCVQIDKLPKLNTSDLPVLQLHLPDILPWPSLRVPWPSLPGFPRLPSILDGFKLPAFAFDLPGVPLRFGFESIDVWADASGNVFIKIRRFRIEGVGGTLRGDITFKFDTTGKITVHEVQIDGLPAITPATLDFVQLPEGCFGFNGKGDQLAFNAALKLFGHEIIDESGATDAEYKLRVHAHQGEVEEIRFDWGAGGTQKLTLPGIEFEADAPEMLTLLFRRKADGKRPTRLSLIGTFAAGKALTAFTTFAWPNNGSDDERELLPDSNKSGPKRRLITARAEVIKNPLSIAIFDFPASGSSGPPRYFQALKTPLSQLAVQEAADPSACPVSDVSLESIRITVIGSDGAAIGGDDDPHIKLDFQIDVANDFEFPFLNFPSLEGNQFIRIKGFEKTIEPGPPVQVKATLKLLIQIGNTLQLEPTVELCFDLERMAFSLTSDKFKKGLPIVLEKPKGGDFLGLNWEFEGIIEKNDDLDLPIGTAFVLAIDGRAFALRQAPGAKFLVKYEKATMPGEPIVFAIDDFALTPKGVDMTATITDHPARLNGLETRFRFTEGILQIKENRVAGFAIAGTGPLPPDLVGDAVADIALQFAQVDGKVILTRGAAKIRGPKLLSCKATRFEFELQGLGLEFVHEGGADHLFFTLSGKARYKLAQGDNASGPLAWLPGIEIQLVDCPLTGNAQVIAKHVRFLIELPKPITFDLMGCFKMELRAIGFVPQFDRFGDDTAAMQLSGQIKFGDVGDVVDARIDFHDLFVARPAPGKLIPRLYIKKIGVRIAQGDTFALEAVVDFFSADAGDEIEPGIKADGFAGEGSVMIKGMPPIAATTAFLRVSPDGVTWKRAWFLYLEARRLSLQIPVLEIYLREIGFGFGYRYTLASFKAVDEFPDVRLLLKRLKQLSLTQGNLSRRDQWRVDLEGPGEDARWTVAMRALFAATSAQSSVFTGYDDKKEKQLPCLYVMDAVLAVRSDLTFFIAARAWLNTNYHDFSTSVTDRTTLCTNPLLNGFALLSVRQSRFLANLSSNPNAEYGDHPPLPAFFKKAVKQSRFSATLLIEPGLVHYELGWPNQLQWDDQLGPLTAEFRGGAIFRLSRTEIVIGQSFLARGKLELKAEFNGGFFGAELSALADVAYGARYIGVLSFVDTANNSALYGAVGVEIRVKVSVHFWLRLKIGFVKISIDLRFSFDLHFTAALQVGVRLPPKLPGALGTATLMLSMAGRRCNFSVRVGINDDTVEFAKQKTERFLKMGLEAEDVEPVPGTTRAAEFAGPGPTPPTPIAALAANGNGALAAPANGNGVGGVSPAPAMDEANHGAAAVASTLPPGEFAVSSYNLCMAGGQYTRNNGAVTREEAAYFLLIPSSPRSRDEHDGFYPVPPADDSHPTHDFEWTLKDPGPDVAFTHFNPITSVFERHDDFSKHLKWQVHWTSKISGETNDGLSQERQLRHFLRYAYVHDEVTDPDEFGNFEPKSDPKTYWVPSNQAQDRREDNRVDNPTDAAFEAAARGAADRFASPHFKFDRNSTYDLSLESAFDSQTSVYTEGGNNPNAGKDLEIRNKPAPNQAEVELRSSVIQAIVRDFFDYVTASNAGDETEMKNLEANSLAFRLGLVLRVSGKGDGATKKRNDHLLRFIDATSDPKTSVGFGEIQQRFKIDAEAMSAPVAVTLFNPPSRSFLKQPPEFNRVRTYAHEDLIAINWRLEYPELTDSLGESADDPEQQLRYYLVNREHIDGDDPPLSFTFKPGDVLHHEEIKPANQATNTPAEYKVIRLRSRFQLVDPFIKQPTENIAPLTAAGKTYLYTITPIDLAGNASSRPLTVVATRFPSAPPLVPTDGELLLEYTLRADLSNEQPPADAPRIRQLLDGEDGVVRLRFSDPLEPPNQTLVPVDKYRVVFRREATLPVGFYGADEDIRGGQTRGLAVTNARTRRTDIVLTFPSTDALDAPVSERAESGRKVRELVIPVSTLAEHGILPPKNTNRKGDYGPWQAEGWRVFLQTESESGGGRVGIRSALAPLVVRLRFVKSDSSDNLIESKFEERQTGLLEWLPNLVRLNLLGPTDVDGEVGFAKVPMPRLPQKSELHNEHQEVDNAVKSWQLNGPPTADEIPGLRFEQHPARTRAVKLRWNQGPSDTLAHPLALHARYQVYEFDAFSHPGDTLEPEAGAQTIDIRSWAARAGMRVVNEVDLIPALDLAKLPKAATDPLMWEAWYPAAARRILIKRQQIARAEGLKVAESGPVWPEGTDVQEVPWYSWRDSYLEWIDPSGLFDEDEPTSRLVAFHPFLTDIAAVIGSADAAAEADPFPALFAEAGPQPSRGADAPRDNVTHSGDVKLESSPSALDLFLKGTAAATDPYGWGILQRMGLAMGLRVRASKPITKADPIPLPHAERAEYARDYPAGEYIVGSDLLRLVRAAIKMQATRGSMTLTRPSGGKLTLTAPDTGETFYRLANDGDAPVSRLAAKQHAIFDWTAEMPDSFQLTYWQNKPTVSENELASLPTETALDARRFLHIEHLFQAGKRIQIADDEDAAAKMADPDEMLALVQLSLRPAVRQLLRYRRFSFPDLGSNVTVAAAFSNFGPYASVLHQTGSPSAVPTPLESSPTTIGYLTPLSGELSFIVRSENPDDLKIDLKFTPPIEGISDLKQVQGSCIFISAPPASPVTIEIAFAKPSNKAWFKVHTEAAPVKVDFPDGSTTATISATSDANGRILVELFNILSNHPHEDLTVKNAAQEVLAFKLLWTTGWISPTDWPASAFPFDAAGPWAKAGSVSEPTVQWDRFQRYVRCAEPTIAPAALLPEPKANDPADALRITQILSWLGRFFLHGGDVAPNEGESTVGTGNHCWIASGYPRSASPLPLTPDAAGRITCFRPIEDLWAHAYRYYVRPRGRYELLWEELGRSRALVNEDKIGVLESMQKTLAAPQPGGADVALSRIRPVAAPFVLSSRRLDPLVPPGAAPPPGKVWEVLIVKHTEQDLIERNRSLVNHLEFRQTAQSLVRRFDSGDAQLASLQRAFSSALSAIYSDKSADIAPGIGKLNLHYKDGAPELIDLADSGRTVGDVLEFINDRHQDKLVADERVFAQGIQFLLRPKTPTPGTSFEPNPFIALYTDELSPRNLVSFPVDLAETSLDLPISPVDEPAFLPLMPAAPDHLDLTAISASDALRIDLPFRSTQFTQGLMAVQYASLPFYYTHKLLLIAQTAHVVSPITAVEHKDFEYVTPKLLGTMEGVEGQDGARYRRIAFPLGRFWDALPHAAQSEWNIEDPQTTTIIPSSTAPPAPGARFGVPVKRRPASIIDPAVVYTIVIARGDSGNVEAVAEYRFDANQYAGFESRQLPVPFRGDAVRIHSYPPDSAQAVRDPLELETILVGTDQGTGLEESVQAVSSRRAFAASTVKALRRWPATRPLGPGETPIDALIFPHSSQLRWHFASTGGDELSVDEAKELRALAADCDPSYSQSLLQLLNAKSVQRTPQIGYERVAEACIGLEQLEEIHDSVQVLPAFTVGQGNIAPAGGTVKWTGFISAEQKLVLEEWQQNSLFQLTLKSLMATLAEMRVFSNELTAGTVTTALLTTHHLDQRIEILPGDDAVKERLAWKSALAQPPVGTELTDLQNLHDALPAGEQAAVQSLIDEVGGLAAKVTSVNIAEPFWRPRPDQNSLSAFAKLKDRLLIGDGVVGFTGLMTFAEGTTLRNDAVAVPDKASVVALFMTAANSGLAGGELKLVVRRGAAEPITEKIGGELELN